MEVGGWRLTKHGALIFDYTGQHDCRDRLLAKRLTSVEFESEFESVSAATSFLVEFKSTNVSASFLVEFKSTNAAASLLIEFESVNATASLLHVY